MAHICRQTYQQYSKEAHRKQCLLLLAVMAMAGSAGAAVPEPAAQAPAVQAPAVQNAGAPTAAPDITLQGCSATESSQAFAAAPAPEAAGSCCTYADKSYCRQVCHGPAGWDCSTGQCECICAYP